MRPITQRHSVWPSRLFGVLWSFCATTASGVAQEAFTYTTLPIPVGARMIGFADGHSASAHDVMSMFSNPASLSFLRSSMVSINRTRLWESGIITDNVAMPIVMGGVHTLAVGATVDHAGYHKPYPAASVQFMDYGFDLGYSVAVAPALSLGVQTSLRMISSDGVDRAGGWVSFGAFYHPVAGINYGLRIQGVGSALEYEFADSVTQISQQVQIPKSAEISVEMQFPANRRIPTFILALSTERLISEKATRIKGAMQVAPWDFLLFRVGYVNEGKAKSLRWGAGIRFGGLLLEYAFATGPVTQRIDAMTFTYAWGKRL